MVELKFVGDIALGGCVAESIQSGNTCIAPGIMDELNRSDILVSNFEFPFSKEFKPALIESRRGLQNQLSNRVLLGGVHWTLFSLATNHCLDWGLEGIETTREILLQYSKGVIGAGSTLDESRAPFEATINGISFGFVNACKKGSYSATASSAGANVIEKRNLIEDIQRLKEKNVDHVVVILHWGVEYSSYPSPEDRSLAQALIEAGASVVVGHHPHTLQGVESYKTGIIVYSLGNFVTDMTLDSPPQKEPFLKAHWTTILTIQFAKTEVLGHSYVTLFIDENGFPQQPDESLKARIIAHVEEISKDISAERFYADAAGNIFSRELRAWARVFGRNPVKGTLLFAKTIKLRYFKMLFGLIVTKRRKKT